MTSKNTLDLEIDAMRQIAAALEGLADDARIRVIRYVLDQLGLSSLTPATTTSPGSETDIDAVSPDDTGSEVGPPTDTNRTTDIRSLVADKRPKSAVEMATLVAYYLAELAPKKQGAISVSDLERYFKQGAYPLPKVVRFTLTNAKEAGYLEAVSRGQYKLTPVGHNLVAHDMPTQPSKGATATARKSSQRTTKKKGRGGRR